MRGTRKEKEGGYLCYKHPTRLSAWAMHAMKCEKRKQIQFPKCRVPSNTGQWIKSRNPEIHHRHNPSETSFYTVCYFCHVNITMCEFHFVLICLSSALHKVLGASC
jgi:hypothetical protein